MKTKIFRNTFLNLGMIFGLAITARAQNLYVSLQGDLTNEGGSISQYTPTRVQQTFATAPFPRGIAFDNSGNFFVASTDAKVWDHGRVLKFPPSGHQSVLGNAARSFFEGLATDTAGNVYAVALEDTSPDLAGIIYKFAPDGTRTVFGTTPGQTFGLAFDGVGNLYAADAFDVTIYKYALMGRARSSLDQAPSHPPNFLSAWLLTPAAISLCLRWATGQTMQFLCSLPQAWRARSLPILTILMAWPLTRRVISS